VDFIQIDQRLDGLALTEVVPEQHSFAAVDFLHVIPTEPVVQQFPRRVRSACVIRLAPRLDERPEILRDDDRRRTLRLVHARRFAFALGAHPVRLRFFVWREQRFKGGRIDQRFRHGAPGACVIVEREDNAPMRSYTAVVERDADTGLLVGYVPGFPGAHSQAESLDELHANLREVIAMLLEDGEPRLEAEFVGTQSIAVA
jgi:predicted RNase H-like HicB family nuclease